MSIEKFASELITLFTNAAKGRRDSLGGAGAFIDVARSHAVAEAFDISAKTISDLAGKFLGTVEEAIVDKIEDKIDDSQGDAQ